MYSYSGEDGKCKFIYRQGVAKIDKFEMLKVSVDVLKANLISGGPIVAGVEARQTSFKFYSDGIITSRCDKDHDHVVLIVGYGRDPYQ